MKKHNIFLTSAIAGLLLTSACSQPMGKELSQIKDATSADSVSYFLGEIFGARYWSDAARDTTLQGAEAKMAYLKGLEDGLKMADNSSHAYLMGLQSSMRMALTKEDFEKEVGVSFKQDAFSVGAAYAMRTDTTVKIQMVNGQFREITERLSAVHMTNLISEAAKKMDMTEITPRLYHRVLEKGTGPQVGPNDRVMIKAQVFDMSGKELRSVIPPEQDLSRVADYMVIKPILTSMRVGETAEFLTNADEFYNHQASYMQANPADLMRLVVTVNSALPEQTSIDTIPSKQ